MPRLPPWLLQRARRSNANLVPLLFACRDLGSAEQELRWITQHFKSRKKGTQYADQVTRACRDRGRGVPLQYLLGSQPFGALDMLCKPGVLIPRPETEAYTLHLATLLKRDLLHGKQRRGLSIIDFCTGTGCIPLLLYRQLQRSCDQLFVCGVDISPAAVRLGRANIKHNAALLPQTPHQHVEMLRGDIFENGTLRTVPAMDWDVIVSNPPYISADVWKHGRGQISHSVRKFEPKLALVPGVHVSESKGWHHADIFYCRLWEIATLLKPRILLMEVGDEMQAKRILPRLLQDDFSGPCRLEVWRDWPDLEAAKEHDAIHIVLDQAQTASIVVKGCGQIRSIVVFFDGPGGKSGK